MDVYAIIRSELYHYGSKIRYGCTKQRPSNVGQCTVQTIVDGEVLSEPVNSYHWAMMFVNKILSNYPTSDFVIRSNKCVAGIVYYQTIIERTTRRELLTIKILN